MKETHYPLITHNSLDATIAYRGGKPITATRLITDAYAVAATLPTENYVLNTCQDRYYFAVGFAATLIAKCVTLMPSTLTPEMLTQLKTLVPNFVHFNDEDITKIIQTDATSSNQSNRGDLKLTIPLIEKERLAARVFTSGSTGTPIPHSKTWGSLVTNVRIEAHRLGMTDGRAHTIIGTVPPQHMYGFESTVLVALQSSNAFDAGRPFYPADIQTAIIDVPRPRLLVTTPFHLNSLLTSGVEVAAIDLIVSATAPLSQKLANEAENRLHTQLIEIYGCTETGQIATRRSTQTSEWQLFNGVTLTENNDQIFASGGHLSKPVKVTDMLEITHNNQFLLRGRTTDMINVAGKRSSLGYLNHQLTSVPGVIDGTFYMPTEEAEDSITRLTAFVVAPNMTAVALTDILRDRIDSVFLPRPIIFVDTLPRNATGKLPHTALIALANAHNTCGTTSL